VKRYYDLLNLRPCDLKLNLKTNPLYKRIKQLYSELEQRHLFFRPPCYFADEWFVPEGDPVIGIPFYLATPQLIRIERAMIGEAEGDTNQYFMKLLRHETGHAISYAYKLYRKQSYRNTFGHSAKLFTESYKFNPRSKKHVLNLDDHYAQSHPDEDFAETFAVWLEHPPQYWTNRYRGWKALDKLFYMNTLMASIAGQKPLVKMGEKMCHVSTLKYTLWTYYTRRRALVQIQPRGHA